MTELNTYYNFQLYITSDNEETTNRCKEIMKMLENHGHYYAAYDVTECQEDFLKKMATDEKKTFPFVYAENGTLISEPVEGFIKMLDNSLCFRGTTDPPLRLKASTVL